MPVVPEVCSRHHRDPAEFAEEFVRIYQGDAPKVQTVVGRRTECLQYVRREQSVAFATRVYPVSFLVLLGILRL